MNLSLIEICLQSVCYLMMFKPTMERFVALEDSERLDWLKLATNNLAQFESNLSIEGRFKTPKLCLCSIFCLGNGM